MTSLPLPTPSLLQGVEQPFPSFPEAPGTALAAPSTHTLYTFGYHGATLPDLLAHQQRLDAMVVDVRYKAETGSTWHRNNLQQALTGADLTPFYYHCQALGNPAYNTDEPLRLADPESGLALLADILQRRAVIILCACADWQGCHRRLVAEAMEARGYRVEHLGRAAERAALATVEQGRLI